MKNQIQQIGHALVFILGLMLFFGGIAASKEGAWIIGLIVTAVNFHRWQKCVQQYLCISQKTTNH
jgi:hypothetical protein